MNNIVIENFRKLNWLWLIFPFMILFSLFLCFVFLGNGLGLENDYIDVQRNLFYELNRFLSRYSVTEFNITQLGDVLIVFPFLTIFLIYCPRFWKALLVSSVISLIVSALLKKIFSVPRPAAALDHNNFSIIGKTLSGHTSLPSGHSITIFFVITIILFAFMPSKKINQFIWSFFLIILGLFIALSRVGVGAHYPFDVVIGSVLGYGIAVIAIVINNKINCLQCLNNPKYYPVLILIFLIWICILIKKIYSENLFIYYVSVTFLIYTIRIMIKAYLKKENN